MKVLLLPLLLSLALSIFQIAAAEEFRTFTDQEGRRIEAVIIRASNTEIWIRRNDDKTFRVDLSTISATDRNYVKEWRQMEALQRTNALEFAAARFTDGSDTTSTSTRKVTNQKYGYSVTLTNRTQFDLKDLQVEYRYFIRRAEVGATGQNRPVETKDGLAYIQLLPAGGAQDFKTSTVILEDIRLRPGVRFSGSNQRRLNDDLRGIRIRITRNGKLLAEFSDPSNLLELERW